MIYYNNPPSSSSQIQQPRPLVQTFATIRTRRSDADLFSSSQFFSAENFSSFIDLDSSGEPVREISDQELTRLGFPVPTAPPDPIFTPNSNPTENFPSVENIPFFQIISRKYSHIYILRITKNTIVKQFFL